MTAGKEPFPTIYVDSQKENEVLWHWRGFLVGILFCEGTQCNLLSLNSVEMGYYFQIPDEKCQKTVAQGADEKRS